MKTLPPWIFEQRNEKYRLLILGLPIDLMKYLLTLICILHCLDMKAQIPVQIFAGNKAVEYNFLWQKDIDAEGKVNTFNFTFYNVNYEDQDLNSYEIYQAVTYNLNKTWGLASGGRFSGNAFSPLIALSYQIQTTDLYLNIFPGFQYATSTDQVEYTLFGLLFYTPKLNEKWNLFSQLAFEPIFNSTKHVFSYQQIRLGLGYKKRLQFGIGANLEQAGKDFALSENYGLFIRVELD